MGTPILGYLFVALFVAVGIALILSARKILEFRQRSEERWLARAENWHPTYGAFYRWSFALRRSFSPERRLFYIRFEAAILILAGVLLALVLLE
jgi:hypothetical protein